MSGYLQIVFIYNITYQLVLTSLLKYNTFTNRTSLSLAFLAWASNFLSLSSSSSLCLRASSLARRSFSNLSRSACFRFLSSWTQPYILYNNCVYYMCNNAFIQGYDSTTLLGVAYEWSEFYNYSGQPGNMPLKSGAWSYYYPNFLWGEWHTKSYVSLIKAFVGRCTKLWGDNIIDY